MPKCCTVRDCCKPHIARGLCGMHYRRWRLYGDPTKTAPIREPGNPEERFWPKVNKEGAFHSPELGRCWEWTASTIHTGYGRFSIGARSIASHRASWQFAYGPIPEGLCVLHRCDNPPCCNPEHLFLGTHADNAQDREAKQRGGRPWATRQRKPERKCEIGGCDEKHLARGLCKPHYREWQRQNATPCSIEGCDDPAIARGWCHTHYKRWQVKGDPLVEGIVPTKPHCKRGHPFTPENTKFKNDGRRECLICLRNRKKSKPS